MKYLLVARQEGGGWNQVPALLSSPLFFIICDILKTVPVRKLLHYCYISTYSPLPPKTTYTVCPTTIILVNYVVLDTQGLLYHCKCIFM